MSVFDVLSLIPPSLRQQVLDALVGFVSKQAKKFLGDAVSDKIEGLKSDGSFRKKFREGLQRAADRFVREYEVEDEDLVAAITADESFFKNRQVQEALLAIVKEPGIYLADEREAVLESFETVLPGRKNRQRKENPAGAKRHIRLKQKIGFCLLLHRVDIFQLGFSHYSVS